MFPTYQFLFLYFIFICTSSFFMARMAHMVANMALWIAQRFQPYRFDQESLRFDVLPAALPMPIKFSQLSKNSENRRKMLIFSVFATYYNTFFSSYLSPSLSPHAVQTHQASTLTQFNSSKMADKHDQDLREPRFTKFPGGMPQNPPRGWHLTSC